MAFGENLRKYRKEKRMTQKELSEKTGIAEITIRKYEKEERRPKYKQVISISNALSLPSYVLLSELDNDMKNDLHDKYFKDNSALSELGTIGMYRFGIDLNNYYNNEEHYKKAMYGEALKEISEQLTKLNKDGIQEVLIKIDEITKIERYKEEHT